MKEVKMISVNPHPPKKRKTVSVAVPSCYIRRSFTTRKGTVVKQTIICKKKK